MTESSVANPPIFDTSRQNSSPTEDREQFVIDNRGPREVILPETVAQISEALHSANERRLAVAPIGYGTFLHLGGIPRQYDIALSLSRLNRLVDYQPTDMTVTVEAGMTLAQLQRILGEHGQWLPSDPPLPERATIGGILAANLSGPVRFSQGAVRDFLIGLKAVRADGTVVKGGGRVVKNVAGYDLPKLYCGSFGTLGVIVEATFKVRPRPEAQTVLSFTFPSAESAMGFVFRILGSELQPFFLELTNFDPLAKQGDETGAYRLFLGFAGIAEEVAYQRMRIREFVEDGNPVVEEPREEHRQSLAEKLRDFPVVGDAALCCKASVLPTQLAGVCADLTEEVALRGVTAQLMAHAGNGIIYTRVPRSDEVSPEQLLSLVDWLRVAAKKLSGYVIVEAIDSNLKERIDVWGHLGGAFPLMKKLKDTLDPHGILNPGRFVGGI